MAGLTQDGQAGALMMPKQPISFFRTRDVAQMLREPAGTGSECRSFNRVALQQR